MTTERSDPCFLALDLGAESGRSVAGVLEGDRLRLEEIHRFANTPVQVGDHLYWDVLRLWDEIKTGLGKAVQVFGNRLISIGIDTWGVDFGLLADDDTLLENPHHYRDLRTNGMMELAFQRVPRSEIYQRTGIQFMQINSLYQLFAMAQSRSPLLGVARTFLNMPDLFNFWLSGVKASEYTIASTTQCYNPITGDWARDLLSELSIPTQIFTPVIQPGQTLGLLRSSLQSEIGSQPIRVVAVTGHDTAAAVVTVPALNSGSIYISSGTWSLMGVETPHPVINEQTLVFNLTNEGGANRRIRLLKNIMGMWPLQECRRQWQRSGQTFSYDDLTYLAVQALPFRSMLRLSDPRFLLPGDMLGRVKAFCVETGQPTPDTPGQVTRCILESLAFEYRRVAQQLADVVNMDLPVIHIIGGGSRNRLLNQFTANATQRMVVAGPVEATATGNILVQAVATGYYSSLEDGRALVRASTDTTRYEPDEKDSWDAAYDRFCTMEES